MKKHIITGIIAVGIIAIVLKFWNFFFLDDNDYTYDEEEDVI